VNSRNPVGRQRPHITLSYAQSLDGSIAASRGKPLSLSSRESLEITHQLRTEHDAILVGIGTILADNPRLTARLVKGSNPRPIILDSWLRTPLKSAILHKNPSSPLIVGLTSADPLRQALLEAAGAEVILLPSDNQSRVDLDILLAYLSEIGIKHLMVEGGASVITSFLAGRQVDRVMITIAPVIIGGQRSIEELLLPVRSASLDGGQISIDQFPTLQDLKFEPAGRDVIVSGSVYWGVA
jgi:GTP cyclohydrolase II